MMGKVRHADMMTSDTNVKMMLERNVVGLLVDVCRDPRVDMRRTMETAPIMSDRDRNMVARFAQAADVGVFRNSDSGTDCLQIESLKLATMVDWVSLAHGCHSLLGECIDIKTRKAFRIKVRDNMAVLNLHDSGIRVEEDVVSG